MHCTHQALKHKRSPKNPQIHKALFVLPYLAYRSQTFLLSWTFPTDCGRVVGSPPNTFNFHLTCRIISLSDISTPLHINDSVYHLVSLVCSIFSCLFYLLIFSLHKSVEIFESLKSFVLFSLSLVFSKPTFLFFFHHLIYPPYILF